MIKNRLSLVFVCLVTILATTGCKTEKISDTLYRGGDLHTKLIYQLKDMGIKTVISLRLKPERGRAALCEKLGIHYIHLPTGVFITPGKKEFDEFFRIVEDPKNQPVYICCQTDKDRTGLYASVYRVVHENVSAEELMKDMRRHHFISVWFWKYKHIIRDYVAQREAGNFKTASQKAGGANNNVEANAETNAKIDEDSAKIAN